MKSLLDRLKNRFYYSVESIKNRYPCKIVKVKDEANFDKGTQITYQAVSKLNLREVPLKELIDDSMLIEKFHPTDCIKLGFLCAADILIKKSSNLEEAKKAIRKNYKTNVC